MAPKYIPMIAMKKAAMRTSQRPKYLALATAMVSLLACASARADSWAEPKLTTTTSADGGYLVRITPGDFHDGTAHAALFRYDPAAPGYHEVSSYALKDDVLPVAVLLSNEGVLLTLDHWGSVGVGEVLHVYDPKGTMRAHETLHQLLGDSAAKAPRTISSQWWRCGTPRLVGGGNAARIKTYDDGELAVDLVTGKATYSPGHGACR